MEYRVKKEEILKKLIAVIFPEFTNKVTWAVVLAGITLLSSSFLEQILKKLIDESFNWNLTDGNDAIIGAAVIAFGLLHNYGFIREKRKIPYDPVAYDKIKRDLEHDKITFNNFDKWIPESCLKNYINHILTNHSYVSREINSLDYFYYEGAKSSNDYINVDLTMLKNELHEAFMTFEDFTATHFFSHGPIRSDDSIYMCMHPEWNVDRGGYPTPEQDKEYDKLACQLNELGESVIQKYDTYRQAIKHILSI